MAIDIDPLIQATSPTTTTDTVSAEDAEAPFQGLFGPCHFPLELLQNPRAILDPAVYKVRPDALTPGAST